MRILVTDGMSKTAISQLEQLGHEVVCQFFESEQLGAALQDFDCVVVRSKTKVRAEHIDEACKGRLKLIIRGGVGVDNIDVACAEGKGIAVRSCTDIVYHAGQVIYALTHVTGLFRSKTGSKKKKK